MPSFDKSINYKNIHWLVFDLWRLSTNLSNNPRTMYVRQRNFFPWFEYKSNWHWCSYQRLRQTWWLRISYRQFPLVEGDVLRHPSYGVYISQLVRFARCCTSVSDFHITSKLLAQGYRYHKLRKSFGKFFRSYSDLLSNLVKYRLKNLFRKKSLTRSLTVIYSTN